MNTQKENLSKPGGYSRAQNDNFRWQTKLAIQNSPSLNNPIISIKGISSCYHCKSHEIKYDEIRDEIYCYNCGIVIRQGLKDYDPCGGVFPTTNKTKKNKN